MNSTELDGAGKISEESKRPAIAGAAFARVSLKDLWLCLALVLLAVVPNLNTLQCGFFSDDFLHFPYLRHVFDGHPELLLRNFYANWIDDDFLWKFYRPLTEVSIALDYLFWQGKALGYHITNLALHAACSVSVFLFVRRLACAFDLGRKNLIAFATAAIFATYSLHVEVINWIVARDESLCELFYFLSFWLYLVHQQGRKKSAHPLSLSSFALALLAKEMAVSLPPALVLLSLLTAGTLAFRRRIVKAIFDTWDYFAVLVAYIVMRAIALGSLTGGYSSSFGDLLNDSIWTRFFGANSIWKVLYPLNLNVFGDHSPFGYALQAAFIGIGLAFLVRVVARTYSKKLSAFLLFSIGWLFLSVAPTVQIWGIHPNLIGSRLFYLGSAGFALLIALLACPDESAAGKSGPQVGRYWDKIARSVGLACLALLICLYGVIGFYNNEPWVETTHELNSFHDGIVSTLASLAPKKMLLIADMPRNERGAHTFYSYNMLKGFLKPPLSEQDLSKRVATMESNWIIDAEPVDSRILSDYLSDDTFACYHWDDASHVLRPVDIPTRPPSLVATNIQKVKGEGLPRRDHWYVTFNPPMPAGAADVLEVWLKTDPRAASLLYPPYAWLYWNTSHDSSFSQYRCMTQPLIADGQPHIYRFAVADGKKWLFAQTVPALSLVLPADKGETEVISVRLVKSTAGSPSLIADKDDFKRSYDGVFHLLKGEGRLYFDASKVAGGRYVRVEISKRHSRFVDYAEKHEKNEETCPESMIAFDMDAIDGQIKIADTMFAESGWYQVRVLTCNERGQVVGKASRALAVGVTKQE